MSRVFVAFFFSFFAFQRSIADELPKSLDARIKVELYAESPQIVTPTGIDVDAHGRVWAIESNTHFPPDGYTGHKSDRLLVFEGVGPDGKAQRVTTFTDGFVHAMSVAVRANGDILVATRKEILVLRDDNNDLKPDSPPKRIVLLDTPGDYPHNGLAGFAFDGLGFMYFGCGENLGAEYKLIGSDGSSSSGGGEGGNIYRCRPHGTHLQHWATGFWNPHASCVDAFGQLFSVDNDPDSRPPCRLLHIVAGGDYGYRFRNGRRGTHPFTAWDGELPGTLPMVAGTGEAPSGVLAYESDGLPDDYRGNLLATSWGDHRIERFRLQPKGKSFTSRAESIITGGENFRPVGLALAPDGSLYFTDWVLKEYKVHGQGRIWRISPTKPAVHQIEDVTKIGAKSTSDLELLLHSARMDLRRAAAQMLAESVEGRRILEAAFRDDHRPARFRNEARFALQRAVVAGHTEGISNPSKLRPSHPTQWTPERNFDNPIATQLSYGDLHEKIKTHSLADLKSKEIEFSDPFVLGAAAQVIAKLWDDKTFLARCDAKEVAHQPTRLLVLIAARMKNPKFVEIVERCFRDPDPAIQRAIVQWAGEERLTQFRPQVEAILNDGAVTTELFEAVLATIELLDGNIHKPTDEVAGSLYVLALLRDEKKPAAVRARALRMLSPATKELDASLLGKLAASSDRNLRLEAIRTLQQTQFKETASLLAAAASDKSADVDLRAEAILGLAPWASNPDESNPSRQLLLELAHSSDPVIQIESIRSLRGLEKTFPAVRSALLNQSQNPSDTAKRPGPADDWMNFVGTGGNVAAGSRVFFHSKSAGCNRCHTVNGRGGRVGPDLTVIARTMDRRKLAQSILMPSREVAPQFVTWTIVTKEGKTHTGMIVSETRDGKVVLGDAEGKLTELSAEQIEQRTPQNISIMPEKLIDLLSVNEFRDLLAFLETLK